MYGNQALKLAIHKIDELQKNRACTGLPLEKGYKETKEHAVTDLQKLVKKQNNRIAQLETRIKEL